MDESGTLKKVNPQELLKHFVSNYKTGCLRVFSSSVTWSIYINQGRITYATHSIAPDDRLRCHLQRLCDLKFVERTLAHLDRVFDDLRSRKTSLEALEYKAIFSLVVARYLNSEQACLLAETLTKETLTLFLLVTAGNYELRKSELDALPKFCELDLVLTLDHCQKKLKLWQTLGPDIWSPYQRPLLVDLAKAREQLPVEQAEELHGMLRGQISLYHLASLYKQDELELAQKLQPYITEKLVTLGEPISPFAQLPIYSPKLGIRQPINTATKYNLQQATVATKSKDAYTIAFVDDSASMLKQITQYLSDEDFIPVPFAQPVKALMQIRRHKPDIILLDIQMGEMSGYDLCKCLRNNSNFKQTPIIMVTGSTGIIDRARAKLVGASGYLTKPFNQAELLKTLYKYLD